VSRARFDEWKGEHVDQSVMPDGILDRSQALSTVGDSGVEVDEEVTEGSSDIAECDIQKSSSESSTSKKSLRRISSGRTNRRGSAKSIDTSEEEP
jgi:hypothetical protein